MIWPCGSLVVALLAATPAQAAAQAARQQPRPPRVTVSAGLVTSTGYPIGDRNAELRRNSMGTPSPLTLFRAESAMEAVAGLDARVGVRLIRLLAVEVGATYTTPQLGVTISQDREGDATSFVAEDIGQYAVEVSGVFDVPRLTLSRRANPYVIGGLGYLRQLHQGRLKVETGRTGHVGGGVRYWLRGHATTRRAFGVRAEARYVRRSPGIDFEGESRGYAALSALATVAF